MGKDVIAPSRFPGIETREDLKTLISQLRMASDGRPIGVKIAAGHIERDLAFCVYGEPDFITIDGRGGATGSSPKFLRDSSSVPTIYALYRARKYLDRIGVGYQPDHHRRTAGFFRFCQSHCHGRRRSGNCLCGFDGIGLPAVPDLWLRDVSGGNCHSGCGTAGRLHQMRRPHG